MLKEFRDELRKRFNHKEAPKDKLRDFYDDHKEREEKVPYIGIVLCYLEKKLK